MAQFIIVRYESPLNQGGWFQWWCLFHYQNNTVSEKKSAGPQLGSQGYPRKVTLRRMAQFISVRYESALNQGSRIQWWCLFHSHNNTVSEKELAGPWLGSRGYPRKVTLRRMVQFISVRYESALNQGSRTQWWCLFHSQNKTVSEKKSAGPQLGSRGYPAKVTFGKMAQFSSVRYESALNQGSRIQWWCLFQTQNKTVSEKKVSRTPARVPRVP